MQPVRQAQQLPAGGAERPRLLLAAARGGVAGHPDGDLDSFDYQASAAWLTAAMTGQILLAWLKLLALDGDLARAEPKTLRYRVLHAAARLVRGSRRRRLKIQATWPWAEAITAAWQRIDALPQAP
ncbi:MAG: transposase [Streptosporangiaceae bacterium]